MRPDHYDDLPVISYKRTFDRKSDAVKRLIRESLQILGCLGIPIDEFTQRQREKMAMALLAVGDVKKTSEWKRVKDSRTSYAPTTREIIEFHNAYLEEHISRGSYDDIRRQDLAPMLVCDIIRRSSPDSNLSDPRRGYQINPEYARIIKNYGQPDWFEQVELFNRSHLSYQERLSAQRDLPRISVHLFLGPYPRES